LTHDSDVYWENVLHRIGRQKIVIPSGIGLAAVLAVGHIVLIG